jgi:hypothetical protein
MSALIRTTVQPVNRPVNWVTTHVQDVYLSDTLPNPMPAGAVLIGEWQEDGTPVGAVNTAEYLAFRPLGNESGAATSTLLFTYFQGEQPRQIGNPVASDPIERLYPSDNLPFAVEVRHKQFTGNANPAWDGWGWRAEIVGGAASRDPSARAIGIYSDEACTQYLYTTGAFTQQQSAWQVDGQGQPLTVWATEYNPGLLGYDNDSKQDVHHACLLGAAQEGHATLQPDQESAYHEFWEHDQGYVAPPSATWVDTGATIAQHVAGGVYRTSVAIPGLVSSQPLKFGTAETMLTNYWPSPGVVSDYLTVVPDVGDVPGAVVWKWA